jgi:hypothetical protein
MSFTSDLAFGKIYEDIAISLVGGKIDRPEGNFKEYDFKNETTKYEVKADRKTCSTGNLFIEYECSGKPSGITATKADYMFYFVILPLSLKTYPLNYRLYKIPISDFPAITKGARSVAGGDGYRSKGYLIKEKDIQEYLYTKP